MHSDLKQFIAKYLSVVLGTFMAVTFVAFVSIPYALENGAELIEVTSSAAQ